MNNILKYNQVFEKESEPGKASTIRMEFSKDLIDVLEILYDAYSDVALEILSLNQPNSNYFNGLKIEKVDISNNKSCFDVKIGEKTNSMKISNFIKYYFKSMFNSPEINEFIRMYNMVITGEPLDGNLIEVGEFKYNPKDVKSTFLSLVTKTYPYGHEDEVLKFLPSLEKDKVGNYYKIIGSANPETMFTSHLDTADRQQKITKLYSTTEKDEEYIITDGNSILGADDKAGVTVMLNMIANNVPGLYYFFIGEERGGIGSGQLSLIYDEVSYLKNIKRCISFDRRNYHSVITQQLGRVCCSNEFATALCKEYNSKGLNLSLDPTGIYTDSASFLDQIPECTNISVGYMQEHTVDEFQNITYLEKLCKATIGVNWNSLPTVRKVGLNEELLIKYKPLIDEIKKLYFPLETKVVGDPDSDGISIRCDLSGGTIEDAYDSLTSLALTLQKHKVEQNVYFEETYIKIFLK